MPKQKRKLIRWKEGNNSWYYSQPISGLSIGFYSIQKTEFGFKLHYYCGFTPPMPKLSSAKKVAQLIHNG